MSWNTITHQLNAKQKHRQTKVDSSFSRCCVHHYEANLKSSQCTSKSPLAKYLHVQPKLHRRCQCAGMSPQTSTTNRLCADWDLQWNFPRFRFFALERSNAIVQTKTIASVPEIQRCMETALLVPTDSTILNAVYFIKQDTLFCSVLGFVVLHFLVENAVPKQHFSTWSQWLLSMSV